MQKHIVVPVLSSSTGEPNYDVFIAIFMVCGLVEGIKCSTSVVMYSCVYELFSYMWSVIKHRKIVFPVVTCCLSTLDLHHLKEQSI